MNLGDYKWLLVSTAVTCSWIQVTTGDLFVWLVLLVVQFRLLHLDLFFTFRTFCYETTVITGIFPEVVTGQFRLLHVDILFSLYLTAVFVLSLLYFNWGYDYCLRIRLCAILVTTWWYDRSLPCAFQVTTCGVFAYILFSNSCCFRCLFGTFCCWIQVNTCEYVVYFTCVCGFCCSSIQVSTLFSYRVTTFRYVFYFSYILLCDSFYFKCLLSFLVLQFMWLHVFMFSTLHTSHVFVA